MPVFDGLEILQINSFRRLQWDLFVKLPNDRARTMSFRGHTVQTVDARSLVGHVVGFRSRQRALNPVIGFALIRLSTLIGNSLRRAGLESGLLLPSAYRVSRTCVG